MRARLRFRHFRSQLLAVLLVGLGASLGLFMLVVRETSETHAMDEIRSDFDEAARILRRLVEDKAGPLSRSAQIFAHDYSFIQAYRSDNDATIRSALVSARSRCHASHMALLDLAGRLRVDLAPDQAPGGESPYSPLIRRAAADDKDYDFDYGFLGHQFSILVVVPLRVGEDTVAWIGLAEKIDDTIAGDLRDISRVEVSFLNRAHNVVISTLPAPLRAALAEQFGAAPAAREPVTALHRLAGEDLLTQEFDLRGADGSHTNAVLAFSLDEKLAPSRALQTLLLKLGLSLLAGGALVGFAVARGVSEPIRRLAAHTRVIAGGDYTARLALDRADELGQLAESFNAMSAGLAERDRVRDLLDKNVSPEVAAQLLRDGAALGGEEREVTILFADLRGFTTLSEQLPAPALLALLNRYLDRMSAEIERQGGVIDKYIGDAIMALFGAPVAQGNAAGRALAAALAMERALAGLNAELAAEGRPHLALGIGVNTARVVAGNIGSQRRLNYSVIGDGVNVAARLQALTRTAEYRTNIITTAATLAAAAPAQFTTRALGSVTVKGRVSAVEIFAVDRPGDAGLLG